MTVTHTNRCGQIECSIEFSNLDDYFLYLIFTGQTTEENIRNYKQITEGTLRSEEEKE